MSTLERLTEAMETGEVLSIIYHGGSQPGTKREIYPLVVTPDKIRARDLATGEAKYFLVTKIEIVSMDAQIKEYNPDGLQPFKDLIEPLKDKINKLESLGWHVELCPTGVALTRFFKNGKLRKGADVGIANNDNGIRPWYVYAPDFEQAHTFANIAKAVELFLEQARKHAPNK